MNDQAYTVEQFISVFKIGRTTAYAEIKSGRLPTYKVGRRRFIGAHAAAAWQGRLEAAAKESQKGAGVAA